MPSVAERIKATTTTKAAPVAKVEPASMPGVIPAPDRSAEEVVAEVTGNAPEAPVAELPDKDREGLSDSEIADLIDDDEDEGDVPEAEIEPEGGSEPKPEGETEVIPPAEETLSEVPAGETPEVPAVEVTPETPEVPAATPEVPAEVPKAEVPEQEKPQRTQEEIEQDFTKAREDLITTLESTTYQLTEDEAQQLITEPEKVLSRLAAKIHAEVLVQTAQGVMNQIPGVLQNYSAQREAEDTYKQTFFGAWPQLAGQEETVYRIGQVYRQMNPNATLEQAVQEIGAQAMVLLKIPFGDKPKGDVTEEIIPPVVPPIPAQPGATTQTLPAKPKSSGDWAELADEFLEEDMNE